MSKYIESTMVWRGINITVRYSRNYFEKSEEIMGYRLAHLEVISANKTPLPFTESGYRSHFAAAAEIEEYGTPIEFVNAWLIETAKSQQWKKYIEERSILTLF